MNNHKWSLHGLLHFTTLCIVSDRKRSLRVFLCKWGLSRRNKLLSLAMHYDWGMGVLDDIFSSRLTLSVFQRVTVLSGGDTVKYCCVLFSGWHCFMFADESIFQYMEHKLHRLLFLNIFQSLWQMEWSVKQIQMTVVFYQILGSFYFLDTRM